MREIVIYRYSIVIARLSKYKSGYGNKLKPRESHKQNKQFYVLSQEDRPFWSARGFIGHLFS